MARMTIHLILLSLLILIPFARSPGKEFDPDKVDANTLMINMCLLNLPPLYGVFKSYFSDSVVSRFSKLCDNSYYDQKCLEPKGTTNIKYTGYFKNLRSSVSEIHAKAMDIDLKYPGENEKKTEKKLLADLAIKNFDDYSSWLKPCQKSKKSDRTSLEGLADLERTTPTDEDLANLGLNYDGTPIGSLELQLTLKTPDGMPLKTITKIIP